jgi:hypothetical protein
MRKFIALLSTCIVSFLAYLGLFGFVVSRPLVVDEIADILNYKLAYAQQAQAPKIFIIAGSNARFSHSCSVIEAYLRRPCVNGGIAVGVALDWVFDSFKPYIHPGDAVYLPLEYEQYNVSRLRMLSSADAAYRFRHDKFGLLDRGVEGFVRAAFAFDLPILIHSLGEMTANAAGIQRRVGIWTLDKQGDEIGHTDEQAKIYEGFIGQVAFQPPDPRYFLTDSEGQQKVIAAFLDWCRSHGAIAIGGLPTVLDDQPIDNAIIERLKAFYLLHDAEFLELPNRSQYPRHDFFDTPVHLRERAQIAHSQRVAEVLRRVLLNHYKRGF